MNNRAIVIELSGEDPGQLDAAAKQLENILAAAAENFTLPGGVTFTGTAVVDPDSDEDPDDETEEPGAGI